VAFNQNYDPGWSASRGRLLGDAQGRLVLALDESLRDAPVRLRYRPPYFASGVGLALVGVALVAAIWWRERASVASRGG
jgi:uncharacterized membrane protein YfhO